MATQPTNLPVPSESPRDLKVNAGKIDEFVTSFAQKYIDRFGGEHYTIEGLRQLAQQAIAAFGWVLIDSFQDGQTLTLPNQALRWKLPDGDGEYYRWDGAFPKVVPSGSTPESTGGIGAGAWLSIGDASLRWMLSQNDGAVLVGGAIVECSTVFQAQAITGLTEGRKIRTYYYNVPVISDWKFTTTEPTGSTFYINAYGGYLILLTPNFASAGIIEGDYVPLNAANNRNVIQKLVRDTRFSKFSFGCVGKFYVLGSIHPQRDDIEILHESGVTLIGRYDDPSVTPDEMGLSAGHLWGFAHFLNPDATVWDDANYVVTATMKNVTYLLNGKIGTEFNSTHSKLHNNNPIGFFKCENCSVIGTGGVISSDHRGLNVDGAGDNCRFDIGYITGTSNNPLQMKINSERYSSVKVGAVYGIKFDGGQTKAVAWCSGGKVDVEIGNFRWDGVNKPILAYANGCQELRLKAGIISGVSEILRQLNSQVCRVNGAWVNNCLGIINKAEDEGLAGVSKVSEIRGVYATDNTLLSAFFDETKRASQDQVIIVDNDFRLASTSFLYFKGKTSTGAPRMWDVRNNIDPNGLIDFSDWNVMLGQEVVTTVNGGSFAIPKNRRYESLSISLTESSTNRFLSLDLRPHYYSNTTSSYPIGGTNVTAAIDGDNLKFSIASGIINFYVLHN
ncbi:tail fiber/spike domain-containing protein [Hafnia paralvei]|uniref:tail fiber/spike domain-containing protein n=1 Tax=Hafnia paralvei TaxID=546367 RepID=UPI0029D5948C|nr:phage tail protein [Hafnia paralvei]MDX6839740.1 phage tail protein [Hafnia paralvei]